MKVFARLRRDDGTGHWSGALSAVAGLGGLGALVLWTAGRWEWLTLGERFIPVAPLTAVLAILLGGALLAKSRSSPRVPRWFTDVFVVISASTAAMLAGALLISMIAGVPLAAEQWMVVNASIPAGSQAGRVSPLTALMAFALAVGTLGTAVTPARRQFAATIAFTILGGCLVSLHAYAFDVPFLYGGRVVPMAVITAFLLLLLALALLLISGNDRWPLRIIVRQRGQPLEAHRRALVRTILALLAMFVVTSGYFWYVDARGRAIASTSRMQLRATDHVAAELERWLAGLRSVGTALEFAPELGTLVAANGAAREEPSAALKAWLNAIVAGDDIERAALYSVAGRLLAIAPGGTHPPTLGVSAHASNTARAQVVEIRTDRLLTAQQVEIWIPLRADRTARADLVLALSVRADTRLLSVLSTGHAFGALEMTQLWQVANDTATLLVVADAGSVRFAGEGIGSMALPEHAVSTAVRAGAGQHVAKDADGQPVLCTLRAIEGTQWVVMSVTPTQSLAAPLRRTAIRTTLLLLLLLVSVAAIDLEQTTRRLLAHASRERRLMTERNRSEARRAGLDRMLRFRSAVSYAVATAQDEAQLLRALCQSATGVGGYRGAFVSSCHDAGNCAWKIGAVSWPMPEGEEPVLSWTSLLPEERAQVARAGESGQIEVSTAKRSTPTDGEDRRTSRSTSIISVPIRVRGVVSQVLTLKARAIAEIGPEEVDLLGGLGADLANGLNALEDRKEVTAQVEQLRLFRSVLDNSNDMIVLVDATSESVVDFNATVPRRLGYTAAELFAARPWDIVVDLPDHDAWSARLTVVRESPQPSRRTALRCKDGTSLPVETAVSRVQVGGRTLVVGIIRDISGQLRDEAEREALQDQFLRAQRMESVGRLAGGVAHDFNNLLTVINGTAELALADLATDAPERRNFLDIREAGDRAATLTRQLLAFSRQQVLRPTPLDLSEVCATFMRMLRRVIGEDITISCTHQEDSTEIIADRGQVEQVMMNLCVNARDAMPLGGMLSLHTESVTVRDVPAKWKVSIPPGDYVLLSISDSGEGMSEELQSRIFEPFFTTKEVARGTGLGLSTVYGIVQQSRGFIRLESTVGVGTTFYIYFPRSLEGTSVTTPIAHPISMRGGTETILLAEDEESIRFVVRRVLERSGYRVLEAATGAEALSTLAESGERVELLMTDMVMPGMSGIALAREVRRAYPEIGLLLASGYSSEMLEAEPDLVQDLRLLSKPYTLEDLLQTVRETLDSRSVAVEPVAT